MTGARRRLERLGGGDVGGDHEFLDQPVAHQPGPWLDLGDLAVGVEHDLAFRQIEVDRAALLARPEQRIEDAVEWRDDRLDERCGRLVGVAVMRRLDLLVGQARRRAHQAAHQTVAG